jgi:hypothetical protein
MKLDDDIEYDAQAALESYGLGEYRLPLYDANKSRQLEDATQVTRDV